MARNQTLYVTGKQLWIGGRNRYDISVYRLDGDYYATWFCDYCSTRGETPKVGDEETARVAGIAAATAHHAERHAAI